MRTTLRQWIYNRYVVILEVLGYVIAATVITGVIYSMFVTVDVTVSGPGELRPVEFIVAASEPIVLLDYAAEPGALVEKDAPVCRVVTQPKAQRRLLALRNLDQALDALEGDKEDRVDQVINWGQRFLAELRGGEEDFVTLNAPGAGLLKHEPHVKDDEVLPADTHLARIYAIKTLTINVIVAAGLEKVEAGQIVRTTVPLTDAETKSEGADEEDQAEETGVSLEGVVESKGEAASTVLVRFENIPETVTRYFEALLIPEQPAGFPAVEADIVVGHQSLFKETFGRRK